LNIKCDNLTIFAQDILHERRAEGFYKEEQRDFIDVFLKEIDAHKNDNAETNLYTGELIVNIKPALRHLGTRRLMARRH